LIPSGYDVSCFDVNAVELFVLSRKLMQLAESALPQGRVATSARLVAVDVAYNPGSSISEIVARTGFPQSHVSASVAKLREFGVLQTEIDPTDHRRTLVRFTPAAMERAANVTSAPIEPLLAAALVDEDQSDVAEVAAALELLARRLAPEALAHLRSEVAE
jgi:DNA-binding MarR family transcriptional regulator